MRNPIMLPIPAHTIPQIPPHQRQGKQLERMADSISIGKEVLPKNSFRANNHFKPYAVPRPYGVFSSNPDSRAQSAVNERFGLWSAVQVWIGKHKPTSGTIRRETSKQRFDVNGMSLPAQASR
jgi:hypothetical protein